MRCCGGVTDRRPDGRRRPGDGAGGPPDPRFEEAYRTEGQRLTSYARSLVGRDDDADQAAQDIVMEAMRCVLVRRQEEVRIRLIDGDELRRYLFATVRNTAHNHRRTARRRLLRVDATLDLGFPPPADPADVAVGALTAFDALLALPELEREIVYLHIGLGHSMPDVVRITGESLHTVRRTIEQFSGGRDER